MSQELQSLSQAYYNLEEEIRLMKSQCSIESHPQLVGEDQSLAPFRYAVVSSDSPREIEALQRKVQNLRERLYAADDWMAMAVDRMNAMASENQSLVSSLQQNCNHKHMLEEGVGILNDTKVEKHILEGEVHLPKNESVRAQELMSKALASNQFLTQQNEEFSIQIDALNGRIRTLEEEMLDVMSDKKRAVDELKVELESAKAELQILKGSLLNAHSLTELREAIPNSLQKKSNVHEKIIDAFAHHNMADSFLMLIQGVGQQKQ
jgi:predicted  nucleic acid-binding Zn-ribbon protein